MHPLQTSNGTHPKPHSLTHSLTHSPYPEGRPWARLGGEPNGMDQRIPHRCPSKALPEPAGLRFLSRTLFVCFASKSLILPFRVAPLTHFCLVAFKWMGGRVSEWVRNHLTSSLLTNKTTNRSLVFCHWCYLHNNRTWDRLAVGEQQPHALIQRIGFRDVHSTTACMYPRVHVLST